MNAVHWLSRLNAAGFALVTEGAPPIPQTVSKPSAIVR
jgi:hypothetical protein